MMRGIQPPSVQTKCLWAPSSCGWYVMVYRLLSIGRIEIGTTSISNDHDISHRGGPLRLMPLVIGVPMTLCASC